MAANEAERAAPHAVLNDVQMMGVSGRIFMSGTVADLEIARTAINRVLESVQGRPND